MSDRMMKNIELAKVQKATDLVSYQEGQVVSKTLVQNQSISLTLFAFDKGEEISTHSSHGEAMIYVLDGLAKVTIGGQEYNLTQGDTIVMPAEVPHAVYAAEQFKMLLSVVF